MQVGLQQSLETHLGKLEVARTCRVDTCVWPGFHLQWPVLMCPRHVSASCCHHPSPPAITVSVNVAGGAATAASMAGCCRCPARPFSVPAASLPVTTMQCPFRLRWCVSWSNRHAAFQPNDLLVTCYCGACVFMEIGTSLSETCLSQRCMYKFRKYVCKHMMLPLKAV